VKQHHNPYRSPRTKDVPRKADELPGNWVSVRELGQFVVYEKRGMKRPKAV
jgi:hypothetical protein